MDLSLNKKADHYWTAQQREMMSLALQLAKKGQYTARPNPMVGCIMVSQGEIVGRGWHQKSGHAHAEINALKQAGDKAKGATCYVTLEPCAHTGKTGPCAQALIEAGVAKVIAAMLDPNFEVAGKGFQMLLDAGIEVEYGLLEAQALELNRGFVSRFNNGRPWVTCKLAMSLDGRTALADGSSKWITGAAARADVQKQRARQDAIITGTGTLLADDPGLNVRQQDANPDIDNWYRDAAELGFVQPARVLLDRQGKAQPSAKIFNSNAMVYWLSDQFDKEQVHENICQRNSFSSVSLLLEYLATQNMNRVLLESGHQLAGEFLRRQLIDELIVYMAPKLMGNRAMGLFDLEVQSMLDTPRLRLTDVRQLDEDIRLTYRFEH